jgi:hypothetical protein
VYPSRSRAAVSTAFAAFRGKAGQETTTTVTVRPRQIEWLRTGPPRGQS